jgi:hypothetical protein
MMVVVHRDRHNATFERNHALSRAAVQGPKDASCGMPAWALLPAASDRVVTTNLVVTTEDRP